jgi:hypothetical protein
MYCSRLEGINTDQELFASQHFNLLVTIWILYDCLYESYDENRDNSSRLTRNTEDYNS